MKPISTVEWGHVHDSGGDRVSNEVKWSLQEIWFWNIRQTMNAGVQFFQNPETNCGPWTSCNMISEVCLAEGNRQSYEMCLPREMLTTASTVVLPLKTGSPFTKNMVSQRLKQSIIGLNVTSCLRHKQSKLTCIPAQPYPEKSVSFWMTWKQWHMSPAT